MRDAARIVERLDGVVQLLLGNVGRDVKIFGGYGREILAQE
ncbi:MAG: hypothetical protein V4793_23485 [Paraburkholderia tropica]